MTTYVLAIDQGTTSTRAILFDAKMKVAAIAQQEFPQHFPRPGWVEHDPEDIWRSTVATCRAAIAKAGVAPAALAAIGVTNQRETTLIWNRKTGKPVHNAIVWQDRRTAETCRRLVAQGCEPEIRAKTGLLADSYFSGPKIAWILDHVDGARAAAERGELAFGTVDAFLLWRLTGGGVHATDATNASRTLLYDIGRGRWDADLLSMMDAPAALLPEVRDSADDFGVADRDILGAAIPVLGLAGDQQAATVGQACFEPGMIKSTYGTGCFALMNTGAEPVFSENRLLTTIACQLDGRVTYALEGSIFVAGAAVQWLRDALGIIDEAGECDALAAAADPAQEVYLAPAFTGLGAPWWDADARGLITGLTRNSGRAELVRAALESVCYQTRDLLEAMRRDWGAAPATVLRVDGGMVASDWTMQRLADMLDAPVDRPAILETTALGAAWLAGMKAGVYPAAAEFARHWALERRFQPIMGAAERAHKYKGWRQAIRKTLTAE